MTDTCKHCGRPIRKVNYALGPEWMHGSGPHGDQYPVSTLDYNAATRHCRTTIATPADEEEKA